MDDRLKNPFGLRNGQIIMIDDLSLTERGLKCGCVCPNCKGRFEARLGDVRRHHFAHTEEGCDETIAYLAGLYRVFKEYVESGKITIPALDIYYSRPSDRSIRVTQENWTSIVRFREGAGRSEHIHIYDPITLKYDSAEIVYRAERPQAVLAYYKGKRIAFRIIPPDTVCKSFDIPKQYEDIATICLDFRSYSEVIAHSKKEDLFHLFKDLTNYTWIYSPAVIKGFSQINKRFSEYWDKVDEINRRQQEEQRAKKIEKDARTQQLLNRRRKETNPIIHVSKETEHMYTCVFCHEVKPGNEFWTTTGVPFFTGKCKACEKKGIT